MVGVVVVLVSMLLVAFGRGSLSLLFATILGALGASLVVEAIWP
jgi:hypothetical protein